MSKFLGNVLALALEKTRTPTGYDFQRAAEVVANAARLDRKRRGYLKRRRHQARMMLASEDRRTREIIDAVSDRHGLLPGDIRDSKRWPKLVRVRDEAIWEMRQLSPPVSYPNCARAVGLTNHTSAMSAFHRHACRLAASTPTPHPGPAGAGGAPPTALPPPALPAPADHLETVEEGRGGTR